MNKKEHTHHHYHRSKIKRWYDDNKKWVLLVLFFVLLILLVLFFEKQNIKIDPNIEEKVNNESIIDNNDKKYNAIITVIDGETETTFTEVWGDLINEGYPICSNLVTDFVDNEGYMSWETVKALDNVGIEFIFHTTDHTNYNSISIEEVKNDIEDGLQKINEHGINNRFIVWTNGMSNEIYNLGKEYFEGGFAYTNGIDTIYNQSGDSIKIQYSYDASNIRLDEFKQMIDESIQNNGWIVLFTRNNSEYMTEDQLNTFKQAFEYAKEHNVGVVTASEGFDLYFGNKLGNN